MTHQKGKHLGGIRSLDDLHARSVIDQDTGCWHCRAGLRFGVPYMRLRMPDGSMPVVTGRRAAMLLATGFGMPRSHVAYQRPDCPSTDCVNPDHTLSGTRKTLSKAMVKRGSTACKPERLAAITRNARARASTKLDMDKAREIRASEEPADVLAVRYGLPAANIRAIRRGIAWKETPMPACSVFTFAGAI